MPNLSPTLPLLIAATLLAGAGPAGAQSIDPPAPGSLTASASTAAAALGRSTAALDNQRTRRRYEHAPAIGAVIGVAAAAGLTASLASAYGHNEGGGFCGACFVQWGMIAIPAGFGAGAGIGFAIREAANDATHDPRMPVGGAPRPRSFTDGRRSVALSLSF